ncbi:MAG: MBL fold metallo-hydrolase [Nakamurella sp.]
MAGRWQWIVDDGNLKVGVTTSRREHTTSTVVIAGQQALLVDPAWDPDELGWIANDLLGSEVTTTAGFATHAHHDHVLWHPGFGVVPRWASAAVARIAAEQRPQLIAALGADWPAELADLVGRLSPVDDPALTWSAAVEVVLVTHSAHAPGHTALWLPAAQVLIAGDMLSDVELPLLEQSTPAEYAAGLVALRPYVDQALVLIPGHGAPAVGPAVTARWAADQRYLDALVHPATPDDDRLRQPGMAAAHLDNRERAGRSAT